VLKKAGIIVAAVATGVLAVSSVAFADTSTDNVKNDCTFGNVGGTPTGTATGGTSLLGGVDAVASIVTDATTQLNTGNCNNLNVTDVFDQDSNNKTKDTTKTMIEDSFNQDN
jgi:hypothetical protein